MSLFKARTVLYSRTARKQIWEAVNNTGLAYEIGGLLVGYRLLSVFYIIEVTFPNKLTEPSRVSFVLDGDAHKLSAIEIAQNYSPAPTLLGIWHSHICDGCHFSKQDRQINYEFATLLNGTLSAIVVRDIANSRFTVTNYYIERYKQEQLINCIYLSDN